MKRVMGGAPAVVLVGLLLGLRVYADSWALPEPRKYYSASKSYYVEVIPRKLESRSQYYDDRVKGKEPAGSAAGAKENYCKGVFYRRDRDGKYEKVWEGRLSNDVAPVHALVSDGGEYVVTFDNWHAIGYGDDIVVIYGPGGRLIRKMSLVDIYGKNPSITLPRSVSSIYWGKDHYIDEKKQTLVLRVVAKWSGSFEDNPEYRSVEVDLRTGEIAGAKQLTE